MTGNDKRLIEDYLPIQVLSAEAARAAVYGALVPASRFVPPNGTEAKAKSLGRANAAKFLGRLCRYPGTPQAIAEADEFILAAHADRRTPETGHTPLLPADELVVTLPMDNGWSKAIEVGKLPEGDERPVVVDMDPAADPVLFWAGKRNRREVPVLPLQRNEIVSESRIAQIIERARRAADEKSGAAQGGVRRP